MTIIRVIDFETTGTEPPAEIIEVGLCDLDLTEKHVGRETHWLCGAEEISPETRAIHHIRQCDVEGRAKFDGAYVMEQAEISKVSAFAAHNSEFEMKWLAPHLRMPMICTYKAALRVWPDAPSHSNGALRYWLEDQGKIALDHQRTQPAHRAGPDAYVTAHILLALFNAGATGREMIAWTKEPRLLPKCPLGKFRGLPWSEVEAGFLGWMLRQPTMEADLKWNAEREIERRSKGANA